MKFFARRPQDQRIPVEVQPDAIGPYADSVDPATLPVYPPFNLPAFMREQPIKDSSYDIRSFPILIGYDFRKRQFNGV